MRIIDPFEAKTHFSSLLEDIEKGEQIIIKKHGRATAKMSQVTTHSKERILETIQKIKEFQKHNKLEMDWKKLRDEGRK